MASSTVAGDRRWGGSARRGGMTVLGKVAVPKPINLPSQRLENHGLDPHVEIVPKGTLSWGSRPSSAGSNAWGTSALSPSTDGGSSSPSHLLGRPSSGGGTRPSTAGSERGHDSNVNAWGSNSRPSSASGVLASNNASSASLRPRSADTRPGSSHLSRFAEPSPEGSGAWGAAAPERMGVASATKEGFSLSSGDFPTLGSEKEESKGNLEPPDHASHGRPSSSGGVRTMSDSRGIVNDDASRNLDFKGNSWRKDGTPFVEDGPRPSMERWHGEPHMYPNPNMAPPHYESWCGAPPVNPPGGVWYRGPPGPPPYGGPVPPGGFPMEPFPYYHPQVPAPGLASSQPIPSGAGHHGPRPKNGDMPQGPHMPHVPHLHPGMPMRPGFYPGPVPYDGYYRPHMGFCHPNERDLPFMGMPHGPPIYARHANQNSPDMSNTHPRSRDGRGPEQVEPGHSHDPRGHKFLVGPNDGWNQNDEEKRGPRVTLSASVQEKGILSKAPMQENAWEDDYKKNQDIHFGKSATIEVSSHFSDKDVSINPSRVRYPERVSNIDEAQMSPSMEHVTSPRDHSLIQKIEGVNAKTRGTGGKQEDFHREDPKDRTQKVNTKDHCASNEANSDVVLERHYPTGVLVPVSRNVDVPAVDRSQENAVAPRRSVRGVQARGDSHARGRFHGQEVDGRGKKSDSLLGQETGSRTTSKDQVQEHDAAVQIAEVPRATSVPGKVDGEPVVSSIDPSDMQRAKMREIAKQRAIQLQKEEEERVKEQKAKAHAKLEELNRRSAVQGVEQPNQKETNSLPGDTSRQDVSKNLPDVGVDVSISTETSTGSSNYIGQTNERISSKVVNSAVASSHLVAETKRNAYQEYPASSQNHLPTADTDINDAASHKSAPQVRDVSKQKRGGYKQRQNVPSEKISMQDACPPGRPDMVKDSKVASSTKEVTGGLGDAGVGKEQAEPSATAELPLQKKKTRSGKSRHKIDESSAAVSASVTQPKDHNLAQAVTESAGQNGSSLHDNFISMPSSDLKDATQSENYSSLSHEDTHGRVNSAWKAQHLRKPRNPQGNRSSEKTHSNDAVVWAPVRSHNKVEGTDQTSQKSAKIEGTDQTSQKSAKVEGADQTSQKSAEHLVSSALPENLVHNSSKTKRAEMERYVPKPVAKELAQQGNIQQPSSLPIDPAGTDGSSGRDKASPSSEYVTKAGASVEHKHMDGKNKHPRAQGSWRQRISADSTAVQASHVSSADSIRPDDSFLRGPPSKSNEYSEKGPLSSVSDGWESVNDSSSAFAGEREHVPSGRGRRHQFKGQKGSGSHQLDVRDSNVGSPENFSHVEANQTEKTSSKENRAGSGSHWQPKSQGYVAHNQQGNRSRGGHNPVTEDRKALKSETGPNGSSHPPHRNQSAAKDPLPASEIKSASGANPSAEHQEVKRERRAPPVKGRPHSPRPEPEALAGEVEPASHGVDGRSEQRPSGYRKNSNNRGRSYRGHESRGDWSSSAQENKQHYSSANRERQRQNSHYEYQPVGSYNDSSRSNESGVQTESQSGASKFQERGQGNNSRRGRGNFYGRQGGND